MNAPVIFISKSDDVKNGIQLQNINIGQFVDRVNWAYGEGGGTASDYYATAIDNASSVQGEEGMYQGLTTNSKSKLSIQERKDLYFHQSGKDSKEHSKANYVTFYQLVRTANKGLNIEGVNDNPNDKNIKDPIEKLNTTYARKQIRNVIVSTKKVLNNELGKKLPDGTATDLLEGGYKWCDNCNDYVIQNSKNETTITNVKQRSAGGFPSNSFFYTQKPYSQKGSNTETPNVVKLPQLKY